MTTILSDGEWHSVEISISGDTIKFWIDGRFIRRKAERNACRALFGWPPVEKP